VIGVGKDGEHTMLMYEIAGARRRYRFDGDAFASRLGTLDAAVGDIIVVCPFALPAVADVDHRELPPGWRAPSPPIYAFAPTTSAPAISTRLADLSPLHVPDSTLRTPTSIPPRRNLLVFATPKKQLDSDSHLWDMGGWLLDPSDLPADSANLLSANRALWLVVDRPVVRDSQATLHGVVALRRILD
jgi:hypothetical protein